MAEDSPPVASFVLGCTFLFVAVFGVVVLALPFVATSLAYNRWLAAECDQPLVMWVLGFLSAFGYLTLFMCFHQLTGRPEKDGCVAPSVLCKGAVIVFTIVWAVFGTLWHRSAEECSQDLMELVRWALLYLYVGVPVILLTYWLLVCFGTAAIMGPLAASAAVADPAAGVVVPRPALRRGTTREILRRSFAQPAKGPPVAGSAEPCSRCGKGLKQAEAEAAEEAGGPSLCTACLLAEEQRMAEEERHTQLLGQLEEHHRWHLGAQAAASDHQNKVVADLQALQITALPREAVAELTVRVDGLAAQLRRQGAKQVATLLRALPGAAELGLQDAFWGWRLLVRRVGCTAVADALARRCQSFELASKKVNLLGLFLAWCSVARLAERPAAPPTPYRCPRAPEKHAAAAADGAGVAPTAGGDWRAKSEDSCEEEAGERCYEADSAERELGPSFTSVEVDSLAASAGAQPSLFPTAAEEGDYKPSFVMAEEDYQASFAEPEAQASLGALFAEADPAASSTSQASPRRIGRQPQALQFAIVGATGLRCAEWRKGRRMPDAFCVCEVPGSRFSKLQTPVVGGTQDPVWNFTAEIPRFGDRDWLTITVYDFHPSGLHDVLGTLTVAAGELREAGFDGEIPLTSTGREIGRTQLRLYVAKAKFVSPRAAAAGAGAGLGLREGQQRAAALLAALASGRQDEISPRGAAAVRRVPARSPEEAARSVWEDWAARGAHATGPTLEVRRAEGASPAFSEASPSAAAAAGPASEARSAELVARAVPEEIVVSEEQAVPAAGIAGPTLGANSTERAESAASEDQAVPAVAVAGPSSAASSVAGAEAAASDDQATPAAAVAGLTWGASPAEGVALAACQEQTVLAAATVAEGHASGASSAEEADLAASEDQAAPAAAAAGHVLEASSAEQAGPIVSEDQVLETSSAEQAGPIVSEDQVPLAAANTGPCASETHQEDQPALLLVAGGMNAEESGAEESGAEESGAEKSGAESASGSFVSVASDQVTWSPERAGGAERSQDHFEEVLPDVEVDDLTARQVPSALLAAMEDSVEAPPAHDDRSLQATLDVEVGDLTTRQVPSVLFATTEDAAEAPPVRDDRSFEVTVDVEVDDLTTRQVPSALFAMMEDAVEAAEVHDERSLQVDASSPPHPPDEPSQVAAESARLQPPTSAVDAQEEPQAVRELSPPESLGPSQPDVPQPADGAPASLPAAPDPPLVPAAPAGPTPVAPRCPVVPGPPPRGGPSRRRGAGPAAVAAASAAAAAAAASGTVGACKQPAAEAEVTPPAAVNAAEPASSEKLGEDDGQVREQLGAVAAAPDADQAHADGDKADRDEAPGSDSTAVPTADSPEEGAARAQRLGVLAMASLAGRAFMNSVGVEEEAGEDAAPHGQTLDGDAGAEDTAVAGSAGAGADGDHAAQRARLSSGGDAPHGVLAMASLAGEALAAAASVEPRTPTNVMWVRITDSPEVSSQEDSDMDDGGYQQLGLHQAAASGEEVDGSAAPSARRPDEARGQGGGDASADEPVLEGRADPAGAGGPDEFHRAPAVDAPAADSLAEAAPAADALTEAARATADLWEAAPAADALAEASPDEDAFAEVELSTDAFSDAVSAAEALTEATPAEDVVAEAAPAADAVAEAALAADAAADAAPPADAPPEAAPAADAFADVGGGERPGLVVAFPSGADADDSDATSTVSSADSAANPADCHRGASVEEDDHPDELSANTPPRELPGQQLGALSMVSLAGRALMDLAGSAKDFAGAAADQVNDNRGCAGGLAKPADRASGAHTPGTEALAEPVEIQLTPPTAEPDVVDRDGVDIMVMDIGSESSTSSDESD